MLVHEMESLLRNVDARLARVEQILPTLARQADLDVVKADLRTLYEKVDANHRHMLVLHEDVRGDIRLLAEHLSETMRRLSEMAVVIERIDRRG